MLVLRQNLTSVLCNAEHFCSHLCGFLAVARKHNNPFYALISEHFNGFCRLCPWWVANAQRTHKLAAYGKIKHRASARLFINNILLFLGYGNLLVLNHKVLAADYCLFAME